MIKTVIFDIGNVLAGFAWESFYKSFGFSGDIYERLARATVQSGVWNEFDKGELTTEEVLEGFVRNDPALEPVIRRVFENINGIVVKYDYAREWIRSLKKRGYQVLVLSNFAQKTFEECGDALGFLEETDGGILSYREKVIKPMPEIYALLISRYRLEPEKCVFLDDREENLAAARAFHMRTVLVKDYKQASGELEKVLAEKP